MKNSNFKKIHFTRKKKEFNPNYLLILAFLISTIFCLFHG